MKTIFLILIFQLGYISFAQLNITFKINSRCSNTIDSTDIIVSDELANMYFINDKYNSFKLKKESNYFYSAGFYRNNIEYSFISVLIPFTTKQEDTTIIIDVYKLEEGTEGYETWNFIVI